MVFNSVFFFVTLAALLAVYYPLARTGSHGTVKALLIAYGLVFYAMWNPLFVIPLLATLSIDYWAAARMTTRPERRRWYLTISVVSNLAMLGFFKYGNLVLSGVQALVHGLGSTWTAPILSIELPIGISFYIFLSLSYTIDVYRRVLVPEPNPTTYTLFISYFPHLVAGPIVRAKYFLPQLHERPRIGGTDVADGWYLIVVGLFLKCVLADNVAARVNPLFAAWRTNGAVENWAAAALFGVQIYGDFAGYSLIAIGLARIMGYDFTTNFAAPYGAVGFSDFWRRWHISLSSFLRDYLYVPLGGNRHGEGRTLINLMLTMLIGGLWHGASLMFVIWGGLHGAYLCAERILRKAVGEGSFQRPPPTLVFLGAALTFVVISVTWIPFRAPNQDQCLTMLGTLFRPSAFHHYDRAPLDFAVVALVFLVHFVSARRPILPWLMRAPRLRYASLIVMLLSLYFLTGRRSVFIYFQF
jgi:alginate O-acetyltransferase complex protein AlgI